MANKNQPSNYRDLYGCGDLTQFRSRGPSPYDATGPYGQNAYPYAEEGKKSKKSKKEDKKLDKKAAKKGGFPEEQYQDGYYDAGYPAYPEQPAYDPYGGYYPQDPYADQYDAYPDDRYAQPVLPDAKRGKKNAAPYPDDGYVPDRAPAAMPYPVAKKPVRRFIALLCLIFSAGVVAMFALDYLGKLPYGFISFGDKNLGAVDSVFMLTKLFGMDMASEYYTVVESLAASTNFVEKLGVILFPVGAVISALFGVILFLQSLFAVLGKKSGFGFSAIMTLVGGAAMLASVLMTGTKTGISTGFLTYGVLACGVLLLIFSFVVNRKQN